MRLVESLVFHDEILCLWMVHSVFQSLTISIERAFQMYNQNIGKYIVKIWGILRCEETSWGWVLPQRGFSLTCKSEAWVFAEKNMWTWFHTFWEIFIQKSSKANSLPTESPTNLPTIFGYHVTSGNVHLRESPTPILGMPRKHWCGYHYNNYAYFRAGGENKNNRGYII